jgi:hypothetical protein
MLRPRVLTGSLYNFWNNALLFAFNGFSPLLFQFDVFASLLTALNVHTPDTLAIPLADLNAALVLLLIRLWLDIDTFVEPPIPLLANSLRPVNTDIVLTIPDLEDKSVQLTLQSCHYFFVGDRDIIAVFFTFVPLSLC